MWTKTAPNEDGFYWYRDNQNAILIVLIGTENGYPTYQIGYEILSDSEFNRQYGPAEFWSEAMKVPHAN